MPLAQTSLQQARLCRINLSNAPCIKSTAHSRIPNPKCFIILIFQHVNFFFFRFTQGFSFKGHSTAPECSGINAQKWAMTFSRYPKSVRIFFEVTGTNLGGMFIFEVYCFELFGLLSVHLLCSLTDFFFPYMVWTSVNVGNPAQLCHLGHVSSLWGHRLPLWQM